MGVDASNRFTATGEIVDGPFILYGLHMSTAGTAGRLTLRDGSATGTIKVDVDTPAVAESDEVPFRGGGVVFQTSVWCTALSNVAGATLIGEEL